ncbi:MAG: hypothetical protein WDA16_10230 [Candidatus Thermoplasmatota archaeon]
MAADARHELQRALDELVHQPSISAAMVVRRDGLYMVGEGSRLGNEDFFSATALALHGSAESALNAQGQEALRLIAEVGRDRVLTWSVDAEFVLVLRADAAQDIGLAMRSADGATRVILLILRSGHALGGQAHA